MSTLDRLREIVKPRSPVPIVADDARVEGDGFSRRLANASDITRAALILGGAVVERSEGAVIVVDREYRPTSLHGRTSIGDTVSVINDGGDALQVMAHAW